MSVDPIIGEIETHHQAEPEYVNLREQAIDPAAAPAALQAAKRRRQKRITKRREKATQKRIHGLYYPTGVGAEEFFERIGRLRKDAEVAIDRLIDFIDAIDEARPEPDADLEPTLGSTITGQSAERYSQENWASSADADEREPDIEENEDGRDDEHSLGSIAANAHDTQVQWAYGDGGDYEDEHDGSEPDEEGEPLLGATDAVDQEEAWRMPDRIEPWAFNPEADVLDAGELDDAEKSGIGDEDGLAEQWGHVSTCHGLRVI